MKEQYFWCSSCGSCWQEDDTSLLDIACPDCCDTFYDGNVERISQAEFDEGGTGMIFDLKHRNTMIVAANKAEFAYILAWCAMNDVEPPWLGDREDFPVALSPNGRGWTDNMDRALYYVRFIDFVGVV